LTTPDPSRVRVGIQATIGGVQLYAQEPGDEMPVYHLLKDLDPEFAREIAQSLTLRSWEVERMRGQTPG
jgi:hypothetical protein